MSGSIYEIDPTRSESGSNLLHVNEAELCIDGVHRLTVTPDTLKAARDFFARDFADRQQADNS